MNKVLFLLLLLASSSCGQFFPQGPRPGQFSGPQQPSRPGPGPFFQRPQQQPGILRQLANFLGLDGAFSSIPPDTFPPSAPGIRGPGGVRPVPPNQQFFRPESPTPPGPNLGGQRNPQQPGFVAPQVSFQRVPSQGPRQPFPSATGVQQQGNLIPPGSTQILTFQPEDVRPFPLDDPSALSIRSPPPLVTAGPLQQQSTLQGTPIRPSEPLLIQPIASQFTSGVGAPNRGALVQNAPLAIASRFPPTLQQQVTPIQLVSAPSLTRTATLKEILKEDCTDFEERGYCESSRRYPMLQIAALVKRCSKILDALYVPLPESNDILSTTTRNISKVENPLWGTERANHAVWSWAKYAAEKSSVCKSDSRRVTPNYARDISGKWVVVLQNEESKMIQHVAMDVCNDVGKECLSGPEGDRHPGTRCIQRNTHHHLVTWNPDQPQECPSLRAFSFPTACLCHFSLSASRS